MTARPRAAAAAEERRRPRRATPAVVHVIEGDDPLLVDEAVDGLIEAAVPEIARPFNLDLFSGDDSSASEFLTRAQSYPFMAERRAVVVRQFDKMTFKDRAEAAFFDYLRHPVESTVLVLVATRLDRRTRVTQALLDSPGVHHLKLDHLEENKLPGWVRQRFAAQHLEADDEACDLLVQLAGPGLLELDNEIHKVVVRYGERGRIGSDEVVATVGRNRVESVWTLTREFRPDNMSGVLQSLYRAIESDENVPIQIAALLYWQVKTVLRLKLLEEKGVREPRELQSRLRARTEAMPHLRWQARAFSKKQLTLWIDNLQRADRLMKSQKLPKPWILERCFLNSFLGRELR